jgi:hypothetical protein
MKRRDSFEEIGLFRFFLGLVAVDGEGNGGFRGLRGNNLRNALLVFVTVNLERSRGCRGWNNIT